MLILFVLKVVWMLLCPFFGWFCASAIYDKYGHGGMFLFLGFIFLQLAIEILKSQHGV